MNITADSDAPVYATATIDIHTKPSVVWKLISDISRWPVWVSDISSAELTDDFLKGTKFTWKSNGMKITSRLQAVEPDRYLAWTGKTLWIRAVHTWELQPLPDGGTRVTTSESMNGFLIRFIYSSDKLSGSLESWLADLKNVSESEQV